MSIEEKAKAYDEALEKIRTLYEQAKKEDCPIWSTYEYIFPQLRESEDERIRKGLIEALKASKTVGELKFVLPEPTREECIAYLEKQKEQKPNYCHHEVDETGWTEEYRKAYYDGWNNCNMQHEQLKADQKPAEWSEEDEKHINIILRVLDRQQCWDGATGKKCNPYQDEIDWLKSLRPVSKESLQPHWKPSEEQMKMLAMFTNLRCASRHEANTLESLYNDLKKL